VKIKAKVRKKDLAKISKSRKCLEIGKDLTRLQAMVNLLGASMFSKDDKRIRETAKAAEAEFRRVGDRYPRAKSRLLPVANGIGQMASSRKVKSLIPVRTTLALLFIEAERSCS
jgi:hypothetical protein